MTKARDLIRGMNLEFDLNNSRQFYKQLFELTDEQFDKIIIKGKELYNKD